MAHDIVASAGAEAHRHVTVGATNENSSNMENSFFIT
jgi:hypothetical protein